MLKSLDIYYGGLSDDILGTEDFIMLLFLLEVVNV